jgi:mannose-1-phosphate guanylyltransferase
MAKTPRKMKAVIFAGGIGTRMWPLSRKKSPKQFEAIIEGKSTLQLSVERLRPDFDWNDIYISTGEQYRPIILAQVPQIPPENVIGEPQMRDVAPAVGYLMSIIAKKDPDTPVAILWSDHLVENVDAFQRALRVGGDYLHHHSDKIVFIGQKPRFANQNLGWIEYGPSLSEQEGIYIKSFVSWHYRPDLETAKKYYRSGRYAWNPGYFIVTPRFVLKQFEIHVPSMYEGLIKLQSTYGTDEHQSQLKKIYPAFEKIAFDNAVVEKIKPEQAVVLSVELGWSDIGTWEAYKEALQSHPKDNIISGKVVVHQASNNVIYSATDQLVSVLGMDDIAVVVTDDVVMVARQSSIPEIKTLLKQFEGTDLEKHT